MNNVSPGSVVTIEVNTTPPTLDGCIAQILQEELAAAIAEVKDTTENMNSGNEDLAEINRAAFNRAWANYKVLSKIQSNAIALFANQPLPF